jgi:hypothetical protein
MSPLEAKKVIDAIANGIDPRTGKFSHSKAHSIVRRQIALFFAVSALENASRRADRDNSLPINAGRSRSEEKYKQLLHIPMPGGCPVLPSRVPLHCAKYKFNNENRYNFEIIVNAPSPLANRTSERVDRIQGTPGFMRNLYMHKKAVCCRPSHAARGLQLFQQQDVSTRTGCIHRVLRSTLR